MHLPPTTLTATERSQLSGNSPHSLFNLKGEGKETRRKGQKSARLQGRQAPPWKTHSRLLTPMLIQQIMPTQDAGNSLR